MIKTAVTGGSACCAGELLRLLINHPDVEILWIHSPRHAGMAVTDIHSGLVGETYLRFTDRVDWDGVDLLFVCPDSQPATSGFLAANEVPPSVKIIDLSADHRIAGEDHDFIYGLPEHNRKALVRGARHVANPGPIATAVSLAMLPLAKQGPVGGDIHATAVAGSTVDADAADVRSFSLFHANVSVSSPLSHPEASEVSQVIADISGAPFTGKTDLIPIHGPFSRGVLAVVYADMPESLTVDRVREIYEDFYSDHSFTFVSRRPVDLKDVLNTNKALMHIDAADGRLIVTVVIDNLLKGAAGNAVHCMNLLFGLHERVGLILKPSAF